MRLHLSPGAGEARRLTAASGGWLAGNERDRAQEEEGGWEEVLSQGMRETEKRIWICSPPPPPPSPPVLVSDHVSASECPFPAVGCHGDNFDVVTHSIANTLSYTQYKTCSFPHSFQGFMNARMETSPSSPPPLVTSASRGGRRGRVYQGAALRGGDMGGGRPSVVLGPR
ncbi:hypothetical protein Pmani_005505 [Petrolisthes manimaculis]|uniref:Uncharacterized protein n=1 Tax=Petrolisthes manimaculis TaxID=1843537 RepID=A0AAE1UGM7_9EUCA|nr:hypothetical protein Pmani_005505 [Petrolisthes manimaculis]